MYTKSFSHGNHVCSIYQDRKQQFDATVGFISDGLLSNERCAYVYDDVSKDDCIAEFRTRSVDLLPYIASGQFTLFSKKETYVPAGRFDRKNVLRAIDGLESGSTDNGYTGARGSAEMTWALSVPEQESDLILYESYLNTFLLHRNTLVLCQYNEHRFSEPILADVIRTHPFVYLYGEIHDNPYFYTPPEYMRQINCYSKNTYKLMVEELLNR